MKKLMGLFIEKITEKFVLRPMVKKYKTQL